MGLKVTVRVSRNMDKADVNALRKWLETTYPGQWERSAEPEEDGALGGAGEILVAVLTALAAGAGEGAGKVAAETVRDQISRKLQQLRSKYPHRDQPDADVEVENTGEAPGEGS